MEGEYYGHKKDRSWIIAVKVVLEQDTCNVIGAYAPQVGLEEHIQVNLWENLEGLIKDKKI